MVIKTEETADPQPGCPSDYAFGVPFPSGELLTPDEDIPAASVQWRKQLVKAPSRRGATRDTECYAESSPQFTSPRGRNLVQRSTPMASCTL